MTSSFSFAFAFAFALALAFALVSGFSVILSVSEGPQRRSNLLRRIKLFNQQSIFPRQLGRISRYPASAAVGGCGFVAIGLLLLFAASCGYHTVGASSHLPPDVKVLAIPSFKNQTHTYHVETGLTNAVIREFNTRTHYRVVQSETDADAVLQGTVVSAEVAPVTYDSVTGRASTGLVTIIIKVTLTASDGRVLYSNPNYVFRDQYQISNELASFFEEQGPALDRLSRDFSRTLVSNILEAF